MPERSLRRGRRRRSERIPAEIHLRITSTSTTDQPFTEDARSLTISRHGASILCQRKLAAGEDLLITRLDTGKQASARVAGMIADRADGYVYALEFTHPQIDLWETEFPRASDSDETSDRVFLVCGCCGKVEAVQFGDSKLGRFEMTHGVLLYCIQCQAMTRWKQHPEDAPPGEPA
jgi:PilZ domain